MCRLEYTVYTVYAMQLQGDRRMMKSLSKQYPAQDVAMLMSFRSGLGRGFPPAAKYTLDVWSGSTVFHWRTIFSFDDGLTRRLPQSHTDKTMAHVDTISVFQNPIDPTLLLVSEHWTVFHLYTMTYVENFLGLKIVRPDRCGIYHRCKKTLILK